MPSIGFGEILVILALALIIFGPQRLPEMGRTIGRSLREFRRATADIRSELRDGLDDEPPRAPSASQRASRVADRKAGSDPEPEPPRGEASAT